MPAPKASLPVTGNNPVVSSRANLEAMVNAVAQALWDQLGAIATGLEPAGNWSAASGAYPSGSVKGTYYVVSAAGTVNGQAFAVGDWLVPLKDGASTATYAGNWFRADYSKVVPRIYDDPLNLLASLAPSRGEGALWQTYAYDYREAAATATGPDILTTAGGVKLRVIPGPNGRLNVEALGPITGTSVQAAIATGYSLDFPKGSHTLGSYVSPVTLTLTTKGQAIHLNGATVTMPNGTISVEAENVTIDLGGGTLSQGVRYATLAQATTVGANTLTVTDASNLEVGQRVASSWGDTGGSGQYPLRGPTSSNNFTIAAINGNVVTLSGNLDGTTETIPAGVTFGDFLFVPLFYCNQGNFRVRNGRIERRRGYYYHTPDSGGVRGGSIHCDDIDFASNALDQFLINRAQRLHLTNCTMAKPWDYAKSGVFFAGSGYVYVNNCPSLKLGNYDSAFNLRGTKESITEGEIVIADSKIIGTNELAGAPAGSFGQDNLKAFEFRFTGSFGGVRISNSDFRSFGRHFVSSGSTSQAVASSVKYFHVTGSYIESAFAYFEHTGAGNGITCDSVLISDTSFRHYAGYAFFYANGISSAVSKFVPQFDNCKFKFDAASAGFARFYQRARVSDSVFDMGGTTYYFSQDAVHLENCRFENSPNLAISPSFSAEFFGRFGRIEIEDADFPEAPNNVITAFGGTTMQGMILGEAKSSDGQTYYKVMKVGSNIYLSGTFYKANGSFRLRGDDYFIPQGSQIIDTFQGTIDRVTASHQSSVTAAYSTGATSINVATATGVAAGDFINVLRNDGLVDTIKVGTGYAGGTTIPLETGLGGAVASGNKVNFFRVVAV